MDPTWREHLEALGRFNEWEDQQLRGLRENYADALAWMAEAWELARQADPGWCSDARGEEQISHLVTLQGALAKSRLRP